MENFYEKFGQKCEFNPLRDFEPVKSGLQVDIDIALKTGVVRDGTLEENYNGIEDSASVIGRVENIFDAIDAARAISKYGKKANVQTTPSTPAPSVSAPAADGS